MRVQDPSLEAALQRLATEGRPCFGAAVERIEPLQVIRRAFSAVVCARVVTNRGASLVYCKVFRSPAGDPTSFERLRFRVEREFRETARAFQAFSGRPGFDPVEALAVYPDLLALVTKAVTGVSFSALLSRSARTWSRGNSEEAVRAATLVGEWLRTYQRVPAEPERLVLDDLRAYIDARLYRLVCERAGGFTSARRDEILQEFDACAGRLDAEDLLAVPVHADFCPDNILVRGDAISVIDFAMAKRGLRHLDLSHLCIHLDFRRGLGWDRRALSLVRESLLEGYAVPGVTRTAGFRLARLVHVAALMADRFNRASRLRGMKGVWLGAQIRRCLGLVHA